MFGIIKNRDKEQSSPSESASNRAPQDWIALFFTALMFYTRLPCPAWTPHSDQALNRATVFFPVIGWIVGAAVALVLYLALQLTGITSAVLLSTICGILITGAFHEDGFADSCDGFGGGWSREKILTIMKDSRIGVYGACGLLLMLLTKISLLTDILVGLPGHRLSTILLIFINAHTLSRFMATCGVFFADYARDNDDHGAKAKPMGKGMTSGQFLAASGFTAVPFLLWLMIDFQPAALLIPMIMALVTWRALGYFKRWIGGYTGDCLGAVQQVTELVFYLCVVIIF